MPERVLYESNPSMFRNDPISFVICILLMPISVVGLLLLPRWWWVFVLLFLTGLIWLLGWVWMILNEKLIVTEDRVIKRTGILSKHINEVYHADINNIRIDQNLIQRILDAGDVSVASAATGRVEITIAGIPHPETVRGILEDRHRQYLVRRRRVG